MRAHMLRMSRAAKESLRFALPARFARTGSFSPAVQWRRIDARSVGAHSPDKGTA